MDYDEMWGEGITDQDREREDAYWRQLEIAESWADHLAAQAEMAEVDQSEEDAEPDCGYDPTPDGSIRESYYGRGRRGTLP